MPRRLPWANKGAGSRTQVKPTPARQAIKSYVASAIDDDLLDDTVLGSSSKGKGRAQESDDELPDLPANPPMPRTKARTKDVLRSKRAQSSSPPPISDDLEQPEVEPMHRGVSKFDLRDDEWMMVEDEFLETAKLFTRHLHIAEYERMKETIEARKKRAEVARPVVPNAKLSISGSVKEKAKAQEQRQKKAIGDVFTSQSEEEEEDTISNRTSFIKITSSLPVPRRILPATLKRTSHPLAAQDSDSEDLDTQRPSKSASRPTATPTPAPVRNTAKRSKSTSSQATNTGDLGVAFVKPSRPSAVSKSRSRISRATPFDLLDEWVPNKTQSSSKVNPSQYETRTSQPIKLSPPPMSPVKPSATWRTPTASRSFEPFDNLGSGKAARPTSSFDDMRPSESLGKMGINQEIVDRRAKRKAEREKDEREKKRNAAKLDDIPTFLF
jgi:hypothetical protein